METHCEFFEIKMEYMPSQQLGTKKKTSDYRNRPICNHPANPYFGKNSIGSAPKCNGDNDSCTYNLFD